MEHNSEAAISAHVPVSEADDACVESTVAPETRARAERVIERVGYRITGYVLTHPARQAKAIVDYPTQVRWFPTFDDFQRMMAWQETLEPGIPPEGYTDDAAALKAETPLHLDARPSIAVPVTVAVHGSAEQAIEALARELGCVHNTMIPSNTGWFVPGKPTAYMSAYDAITALVDNLKCGGTVYTPERAPRVQQLSTPAAESESVQGGLF